MEEWVGKQWDRFIRRAAHRQHDAAAVSLTDVQRTLALMFRAAGGAHAVRLSPASERRVGGARDWVQRVAGTGTHAATGRLEPEALSLPPSIAVHADPALNRGLYLWLAALAAHIEPTGDWIADNLAAQRRVLPLFPGLADRFERLLAAERALRPDPARLRGRAAEAERRVQQALNGNWPAGQGAGTAGNVQPDEVAPVWMWLDTTAVASAAVARDQDPAGGGEQRPAATQDARRRRAQAVTDERDKAPLMMFFRAESILSWGEFVKVNRASDDDDDGNALAAANDMDVLAIAPDGQTTASRVKFDLDLPSAAADDRPLGPGIRLPEWDWRQQALIADHCALQTLVHTDPPPFEPPTAWRTQASRSSSSPSGWACRRPMPPRSTSPAVFTRRVRSERSLATLLLADLSLSTDAYATQTARVIDVIRDALYVFGEALHASGDPFEMLGFSSVRRQNVRVHQLKGFDEPWGPRPRDRVGAIKPGYYTRMGAAIRHATARLAERPERQRLLLILTDGKPNDLDVYEGRYGLEDTRHAVQAARDAGLVPFCITIDETAHDYLPALFGQQGYALVHRPQDLVQRLSLVYTRFLRNAGR